MTIIIIGTLYEEMSIYMNYEVQSQTEEKEDLSSLCFIFCGDKLLVNRDRDIKAIPSLKDISDSTITLAIKQYIGELQGKPCYTGEVDADRDIPNHMEPIGLRQLFGLVKDEEFWMAGKAIQIVNWDRTHRYCGQCGHTTEVRAEQFAKVCPQCGLINYPRISPAIIVAITKGDEILLAKNARSTLGFYSVLAGFVEPGETLEECVKREVKEEVGIDVKNISYFGSQPWPFPNSLMIGFTAEYDKGEILVDKNELSDAKWFKSDNLPQIPSSISISRRLIDWFVDNNK